VTCLTEGNNRIQDTVAPFLVAVTIGLYGYEDNNGIWGVGPQSETSVQYSSVSRTQEATSASAVVLIVIVMCAAVSLKSE
jgi:hypothetical protein